MIIWHPKAITSLNPATGETALGSSRSTSQMGLAVATPVFDDGRLLVSAFFNGSMLLELDADKPAARLVWKGKSDSEIKTDGLHALIATPFFDGATHIYGICSYGQFRALDAGTGERVWVSRCSRSGRRRAGPPDSSSATAIAISSTTIGES